MTRCSPGWQATSSPRSFMARDRGPNSGDGSLQPTHAGLRGGRSCRHSTALRPSMGFKGADPNLAPDTLAHRLGPLPRESDLPSVAPARNPWYPIGTCHGHGEALGCPWRSGNRGRVTSCRLEAPPPTEGAIGEGRFRVRSAPPRGQPAYVVGVDRSAANSCQAALSWRAPAASSAPSPHHLVEPVPSRPHLRRQALLVLPVVGRCIGCYDILRHLRMNEGGHTPVFAPVGRARCCSSGGRRQPGRSGPDNCHRRIGGRRRRELHQRL